MKIRLILIIIAFIVVPTTVLSIIASYAVRNSEYVIQNQLKSAASSSIHNISFRLRLMLDSESMQVCNAFSDILSSNIPTGEVARVTADLLKTHGVISEIYLYLNPWGIMYPEDFLLQDGKTHYESLVWALRKQVASGTGGRSSNFYFRVDDNAYGFMAYRDRKDLFVGYGIKTDRFKVLLNEMIRQFSTNGITIRADDQTVDNEDVHVDDTFSRTGDNAVDVAMGSSVLAVGYLVKPYENIRLTAFMENPEAVVKAERFQKRLLLWGLFVLTAGVCVGVVLVVIESLKEVRRISAKGAYVIGVSHDLRTPVASMKMLAESLFYDNITDPEKKKLFLSTIVGECERLSRLIERVLYFVRFGEHAITFSRQLIDPAKLVEKTSKIFFMDPAGGVRGSVSPVITSASGIPEIMADENAVSQVIMNLLDNALKYGRDSQGGISEIRISIDVARKKRRFYERTADYVRISVRDTGRGISRWEQKKIFKPYYRSISAKKENLSGVGLGLALCKYIIEGHGGWIEVESETGKGSEFSVFLPTGLRQRMKDEI